MTANNEPETKSPSDRKGEVRPSTGKNGKIAEEKDDELLSETAAAERKRDS
jgi:hypothetical protein